MRKPPNYFSKVDYSTLNARQQEVHNFHIIGALLARHGFATYPIRDDWNGGDMFARHMTDLKRGAMVIQIKSRVTFDRKYINKQLWIGFPFGVDAYVYPHDETLAEYRRLRAVRNQPLEASKAWSEGGCVHWPTPTEELRVLLAPYLLGAGSGEDDRFTIKAGDLEILSPGTAND
jgi:hypothetical protein